jgi:hypothetical protein
MNYHEAARGEAGIEGQGACCRSKDGTALVIVIGMLAVMLIAAVAFSVSMRVERRGAGNFSHNIRARQILHAALAQSIDDVEAQLTGDRGGLVTNGNAFHVALPADVYTSQAEGRFTNYAPILSEGFMRHVPSDLADKVLRTEPEWRFVFNQDGRALGRYGYVLVDCTGLIDANAAGGLDLAGRNKGTSVEEIQLGGMPELPGAADTNAFFQRRAMDKLYATYDDLTNCNLYSPPAVSQGGLVPPVSNFFVVSHSRVDRVVDSIKRKDVSLDDGTYVENVVSGLDWVTNLVDLSGSVSDLTFDSSRRDAIQQGFKRAGIDNSEAEFVFWNLIDYLDTNCIPNDLQSSSQGIRGPFTEAVPMVNEVRVQEIAVDGIGTNELNVSGGLHVEWWYPFLRGSSNAFQLNAWMTNSVIARGKNGFSMTNESVAIKKNWRPGPLAFNGRGTPREVKPIPEPTRPSFDFSFDGDTNEFTEVEIKSQVRVWVTTTNDHIVDAVPFPTNKTLLVGEETIQSDTNGYSFGKECIDPRFNWKTDDSLVWAPQAEGSMGGTNKATELYYTAKTPPKPPDFKSEYRHPGLDDDWDSAAMYVSDAGELESLGELGAILTGTDNSDQWRTMRLYNKSPDDDARYEDYKMHSILDVFTLRPQSGEISGLINLNTTKKDVLACAFNGIPSLTLDGRFSRDDAEEVAKNLIEARNMHLHCYTNLFETNYLRLSDLGYAKWYKMPGLQTNFDLQREEFIGRASHLFTTSENMMVVLVGAQAFAESVGGMEMAKNVAGRSLSDARAVVYLWRDAFPNSDGIHEYRIHHWDVLED